MKHTPFSNIVKCACLALCVIATFSRADEEKHARPDPKRFAKDIQKFTDDDAKSPPAKGGIVFTGSSSIRLWGDLSKVWPDLPVLNRGFGGSVANDLIVYANEVALRYEPRVLVVYEGGNDLHGRPAPTIKPRDFKPEDVLAGLTPQEALADYTRFLTLVHEKLPKTVVIVNSVKIAPVRVLEIPKVNALNVLLEQCCKDKPWTIFVEATQYLFATDGQPREELYRKDRLHLNDEGYAKWKAILDPVLRKAWAEATK